LAEVGRLGDPQYFESHDSNVITPGTAFVLRLADHLRGSVRETRSTCAAWSAVSVILSDASVPGEGEHEIMDFIRSQRLQPGYCPSRRHCISGLDADLLFLGLGSHELYFTILREKVFDEGKGFQFVSLWVLRQFLERDLRPTAVGFDWDFENALEDLIFMCFTAGNDFLPALPGMSIAAGAINAIIVAYQQTLPKIYGYITKNGVPHAGRLVAVISQLTKFECRALENILHPEESVVQSEAYENKICDCDE
jgi:5'-3' exonuclease